MGLVANFFTKIFGAIVSAIWQWLVYFQTAMSAALPLMMALVVAILPAPLGASVAPYFAWIAAINQWLPLSEAVLMGVSWIVFRAAWLAVRFVLRFFSFGLVGRG